MARGSSISLDMGGGSYARFLTNFLTDFGLWNPVTIAGVVETARGEYNQKAFERIDAHVVRLMKERIPVKSGNLKRSYIFQRESDDSDNALLSMRLYGRFVQVRGVDSVDSLLYSTVKVLLRRLPRILSGLAQEVTGNAIRTIQRG